MTWVKICGLCRPADAELALSLGATHLGCVVADDSPRRCGLRELFTIRTMARGRASFVLVVRGMQPGPLRELSRRCAADLVQWHGIAAAGEDLLAAELPLLRVRQVEAGDDRLPDTSLATATAPMLLDGGRGGAGVGFPWHRLPVPGPAHTFVAGGITPDNVGALLARSPWGIDVASGVESAPGHKDAGALRALFEQVEVRA